MSEFRVGSIVAVKGWRERAGIIRNLLLQRAWRWDDKRPDVPHSELIRLEGQHDRLSRYIAGKPPFGGGTR